MVYDVAIIGAGCSGLSLAYQIFLEQKLNLKVIIIDKKREFKKDRTWSFWKVDEHEFDDCLEKKWNSVEIKYKNKIKVFNSDQFPYQSINSLKFYNKIINQISDSHKISLDTKVKGIKYKDNIYEIQTNSEVIHSNKIFDSRIPEMELGKLYRHFYGIEIETNDNQFDNENVELMNFDCEQKNGVHFFYTLPFDSKRALIETTWLSILTKLEKVEYEIELKRYIESKFPNIKEYKVLREEIGAIPMFRRDLSNQKNYFEIGLRGNVNRMSTGYTFTYVQKQSKIITKKLLLEMSNKDIYPIDKKCELLDSLFIKVLKQNADLMPGIFYKIFDQDNHESVIKFLSSCSNFKDDLNIIKRMPKGIFLRNLLN